MQARNRSQYSKEILKGVLKRWIEFSTLEISKYGIMEGPPVGAMNGPVHGPFKTSRKHITAPEYGGTHEQELYQATRSGRNKC